MTELIARDGAAAPLLAFLRPVTSQCLGQGPRPASQSPQPHLEDSTTYQPLRPLQRGSHSPQDRGVRAHRPPSHNSKMVLSTLKIGPL